MVLTATKTEIPPLEEISTADFLSYMRQNWYQGEHVTFLGPTGRGKTTLAKSLLAIRQWVVVLGTKKYDDTLDTFKKAGYRVIDKWPPYQGENRVIFWRKPKDLQKETNLEQAEALYSVLEGVYQTGAWCVFIDEAGYAARYLGMGPTIGTLINQARSAKISIVCGAQRPHSMAAQLPLEVLSQPQHKIMMKYTDSNEIEACARVAGIAPRFMVYYMQSLNIYYPTKHSDFLYFGDGKAFIVRNK